MFLMPLNSDTEWFDLLYYANVEMVTYKGRIPFVLKGTEKRSTDFDSATFLLHSGQRSRRWYREDVSRIREEMAHRDNLTLIFPEE